MIVGVPNIEIQVLGRPLTVHTDDTGRFVISGVPAAQPVTVSALVSTQPNVWLQVPDLVLNAGQTLDVGALSLSGCASAVAAQADGTPRHAVIVKVDQTVLGETGTDTALPATWDVPLASFGVQSALPDLPAIDTDVEVEGGPTE
jgi:hypothetical protein